MYAGAIVSDDRCPGRGVFVLRKRVPTFAFRDLEEPFIETDEPSGPPCSGATARGPNTCSRADSGNCSSRSGSTVWSASCGLMTGTVNQTTNTMVKNTTSIRSLTPVRIASSPATA